MPQEQPRLKTHVTMVTCGLSDDGTPFYHPLVTQYEHDDEAAYRTFEKGLVKAGDLMGEAGSKGN